MNIITSLISFFGSAPFCLTAEIISLTTKGLILASLFINRSEESTLHRSWRYLIILLVSAMATNFSWIIKLVRMLILPQIDYRIMIATFRISWAMTIVQYQALALFINSFTNKNRRIVYWQWCFLVVSVGLCAVYAYLAIFYFNVVESSNQASLFNNPTRPWYEFELFKATQWFYLIFISACLISSLSKLKVKHLPKIIKKQLITLITYILGPYLLLELIQISPFSLTTAIFGSSYLGTSISTLLLSYAFYFSAKQLINLRFLNLGTHVQADERFNFIDDFKGVLENLSLVTNPKDLVHLTQRFFQDAFNIPMSKLSLYVRKLDHSNDDESRTLGTIESLVEGFVTINTNNDEMVDFVKQNRQILIRDEIAFSHFYKPNENSEKILQFLDALNAGVFIPVFEKRALMAYIIVEKEARPGKLYSDVERDEMLIFAKYISTVVKLLRTRNVNEIVAQQKELREELIQKHQEIAQYKESMRSFLRTNKDHNVGLIFYKKRKFTMVNHTAKLLVNINLNTQAGHPLTQKIKRIAQQVEDFKTPQTTFVHNTDGERLVVSAMHNSEHNNVIITVSYPELSDIVKRQMESLKDPSRWDYLLYLETTKSGKLINQLIPGSGENILNFKIDLLKVALSPKALLLEMPEEDVQSTVEIIHHISLRETLHILTMAAPEKNLSTGIKLFGINPIFDTSHEEPLLQKLNNSGTLFIRNIDCLSLETQEYLAEFIKYGYFRLIKSDQKISSDVRLIVSTNQDLNLLVKKGRFSKALYNELKHMTLSLAPLFSLPDEELNQLADELTEQAIRTSTFKNMLELTDKEKTKLTAKKPVSLQEFKAKVQQLLISKSKKNDIYQETEFDAAYNVSDPQLIEAARLGKHALRDPKILAMLWNKFQNQNKIATFLGVNRSSVNRRCKEYNLQ